MSLLAVSAAVAVVVAVVVVVVAVAVVVVVVVVVDAAAATTIERHHVLLDAQSQFPLSLATSVSCRAVLLHTKATHSITRQARST